MKIFRTLKKIILVLVMFLWAALSIIGHVPDLPSSKPISHVDFGPYIRAYMLENLFAIVFFIISLVIGLLMLIYGLSVKRNISSLKNEGAVAVNLGEFVLVSGIWVITDSHALAIITTDYGGIVNKNAVAFLSYISIMLLPIIFISFVQKIIQIKMLWIMDGLFLLNLSMFVINAMLLLDKKVYFLFLIIHHLLIYIVIIVGIVYFVRNFRGTKDIKEKWLFQSTGLFLLFSGSALVSFLLGFPNLYVIIFSIGLIILVVSMFKITIYNILSTYKQLMKTEIYKSMAYVDAMTNIKNRNAFINENYDSPIEVDTCCILIDINKLKWVNDTLGHSYGDELIRCTAKVIHNVFHDIGECYRIGGDEFTIVCKNVEESLVKSYIDKMNDYIQEHESELKPSLSLACGYAFPCNGINTFIDLYNAADKNMYMDKESKRS